MKTGDKKMKLKTIKRIAFPLLLVAVFFATVLTLSACNTKEKPQRLELEGQREVFFVGDTFETGVDFAVYAVYKDGTRERITQGYTVKQESGMDMLSAGDYVITVEYEGLKAVYSVSVNEPTDEITKLTIDTSSAKTSFMLGDTLSLEGLRVTAQYKTSNGKTLEVTYGEDGLKKFDLTVTDPSGATQTTQKSVFEQFGTHTVTLSYNGISASYSVAVENVNLSSVKSAIYVAKYGAQFVNEGKMSITNTVKTAITSDYVYAFGKNYTFIGEGIVSKDAEGKPTGYGSEYHLSLDPLTGKLVAVTMVGGEIIPSTLYVPSTMNGVPIDLWWHDTTSYGIEAAIENLYSIIANEDAVDCVEIADEATRTYKFSYGYLMHRITGVSGRAYKGQIVLNGDSLQLNDGRDSFSMSRVGSGDGLIGTWEGKNDKGQTWRLVIRDDDTLDYTCGDEKYENLSYKETGGIYLFEYGEDSDDYYFVNEVEFTMNGEYSIVSASFTQKHYTDGFSAGADGVVRPDGTAGVASTIRLEMTQSVGERTATNPHAGSDLLLTDFDLICDDELIEENTVIRGLAGDMLSIKITNLQPGTASLAFDVLSFSDGVGTPSSTIFTCNGYAVYRQDDVIRLTLSNGGDWTLVISSENVTKRIKLHVVGRAPEKLTTEVYRDALNSFAETDKASPMVGVPVYFRAVPNQYANGAYTAELLTKTGDATIELTQVDGVECWKFVSDTVGSYEIRMTSTQDETVSCILTVTVTDVPDYADLLTGTYQTTDGAGNAYTVKFERDSGANVGGTVTVEYTPKGGEKQTQTMRFCVSEGDIEPKLESLSGTNLGVAFKVDAAGRLKLEDRYGNLLTLTRVS